MCVCLWFAASQNDIVTRHVRIEYRRCGQQTQRRRRVCNRHDPQTASSRRVAIVAYESVCFHRDTIVTHVCRTVCVIIFTRVRAAAPHYVVAAASAWVWRTQEHICWRREWSRFAEMILVQSWMSASACPADQETERECNLIVCWDVRSMLDVDLCITLFPFCVPFQQSSAQSSWKHWIE